MTAVVMVELMLMVIMAAVVVMVKMMVAEEEIVVFRRVVMLPSPVQCTESTRVPMQPFPPMIDPTQQEPTLPWQFEKKTDGSSCC